MLQGLYTATAGMVTEMSAVDVLSNNLANADTVGFKEDFETLVRQGANPLSYGMGGAVRGTGVLDVKTGIDFTLGSMRQTSNPLDVALQGPGMFGIQSGAGAVYARNGRFHLSATRQLVNVDGNPVLGVNGQPISLPDPQGQPIVIRADGTVQVGTSVAGQIGIFGATGWQKAGNGTYTPVGTAAAISTTQVRQGALEMTNLDLTHALGAVMGAERAYEAAVQMQHMQDQLAQQAANDIGKLP
ncbi:MAG: flagellar hook-basal body protein [Ktedonobacterales bacterium]|nr:flagellar hook-basal body protein [Ktedonobacterales bacterium]